MVRLAIAYRFHVRITVGDMGEDIGQIAERIDIVEYANSISEATAAQSDPPTRATERNSMRCPDPEDKVRPSGPMLRASSPKSTLIRTIR